MKNLFLRLLRHFVPQNDKIVFYFRVILNKIIITNNIEKINPSKATNDISPTLGPDSETKTIAVAIIFAPKTIVNIKLTILDFMS